MEAAFSLGGISRGILCSTWGYCLARRKGDILPCRYLALSGALPIEDIDAPEVGGARPKQTGHLAPLLKVQPKSDRGLVSPSPVSA